MSESPNLSLPYILAAQAQKHVTHNEAIRILDALVQIAVADKDLATPPTTPTDGARYIVGAAPTGAWDGKTNAIAAWQDGAWAFYTPMVGWLAWVADEGKLYAWNQTAWGVASGGGINPASLVGVNATADTINRLAVKSDAVLFSHDDVTPGNGDVQVKVNKATAGDTGSFLFQTNWSGRAEIGTTGDDDFHFKVSPDGTTWRNAIVIDRASGVVSFPFTTLGGGGASGINLNLLVNGDFKSTSGCSPEARWPPAPTASTAGRRRPVAPACRCPASR